MSPDVGHDSENESQTQGVSPVEQANNAEIYNAGVMQLGFYVIGSEDQTTQNSTILHKEESAILDQQGSTFRIVNNPPDLTQHHRQLVFHIRDHSHIRWCYERAFAQIGPQYGIVIWRAFIKYIDPQKQNWYPYNGFRRASRTVDPELIKLGWWPNDINNRSPYGFTEKGGLLLLFCWWRLTQQ